MAIPALPVLFLQVALFLWIGLSGARAQLSGGQIEAHLLVDDRPRAAGEPFLVGVRLEIENGWHIYWENPGSPGAAPKVTWTLPDGYTAGPVLFPVPHRFDAAGFRSYGYEKEAILLAAITPPPGGSVPATLSAKVVWLVCAETCVRGSADLSWKTGDPSDPDLIRKAAAALPKRVAWPVETLYDSATREVTFGLVDSGAVQADLAKLYFYPASPGITDSAAAQTVVRNGQSLMVKTQGASGFAGIFPPETGGILAADDGSAAWRIGGPALQEGTVAESASGAEKKGGDAPKGWGYWLQRPLIVSCLAAVMLLIALNLFGVFEIGGSLTGVGADLTHREGLAGSFFSGALATLLATPCTAPAMGFAITYAMGAPIGIAVLIFTLIGVGMATPYLLLSAFPAWIARLPKPGAWMETFKQTMAFPMIVVMAWLLSVLAQQVDSEGFFLGLLGLVSVAIAAWIFGRFGSPSREELTRRIAWGSSALLLLTAFQLASRGAGQERPVVARDVEAEIAALQDQGKSVFVDFTASWCVTCQVNKPAIHGEEVQRLFAEKGVAFLEVDWTQEDPAILKVLQKHGRNGVPLYLLFSKDKTEPPKVLPNLLTPGLIAEAVQGGPRAKEKQEPKELGLWAALGGAFLGGMILNLMPCVFPVISLKIMGFVAQAGEDRRRILHHGLAFTAGVLVFFWIITAVLLSARAALGA
ncbi:MAG: thiol:disulfide interchange protein DsbD [Verrucomicrobia bacterium]|nr:MAG: thiol:disulfide interchange protein DsbD [Verrucomicrobiota bacterium]